MSSTGDSTGLIQQPVLPPTLPSPHHLPPSSETSPLLTSPSTSSCLSLPVALTSPVPYGLTGLYYDTYYRRAEDNIASTW